MSATRSKLLSWLMPWRRKASPPTELPLGLDQEHIQALSQLRSTPAWPRYLAVLERLGEQQAAELASGLPHDRYLFASGALTALRRVFTLADDLIAASETIKEHHNARDAKQLRAARRHADTFVNTPWYDGWRRDATRRDA